jgi:hypothetical protein
MPRKAIEITVAISHSCPKIGFRLQRPSVSHQSSLSHFDSQQLHLKLEEKMLVPGNLDNLSSMNSSDIRQ